MGAGVSGLETRRPASTDELLKVLHRAMKHHDFSKGSICWIHLAKTIYLEQVVSWCVDWLNAEYHGKFTAAMMAIGDEAWRVEIQMTKRV